MIDEDIIIDVNVLNELEIQFKIGRDLIIFLRKTLIFFAMRQIISQVFANDVVYFPYKNKLKFFHR